jgi:hypothetical protein
VTMAETDGDPRAVLLGMLDQAFDHRAWHGTNLRGSLRGVRPAWALWRPHPDRHNIWEILLHCAYWKYAVHRRLVGGIKRGSFPREPSNWPALPIHPHRTAWRADIALLDESHRTLRDAVAAVDPARLSLRRGRWNLADHIAGIAAHDVYHAGQIQLLKRLQDV